MRRVRRSAIGSTLLLSAIGLLVPLSSAGAAATSAIPAVKSVSLSLGSAVVTPGQVATITAQVKPAAAGIDIVLRKKQHGRFLNLKIATTNREGVATFQKTFPSLGDVVLRASVVASVPTPSLNSNAVVESVQATLPLILAPNQTLGVGSRSPLVLLLQQRLGALGYWLGTPGGGFGDATEQAVYALEKVANLPRTGVVGTAFAIALNARVVPHARTTSGDAIEVDLERDLVLFVRGGVVKYALNTSTGGGYTYIQDGVTNVATTPRGVYAVAHVVDGTVTDTLGTLWRPRYFYEGYALHGDSYVPAVPVSHGCVRVSNEAIDWVWAQNLAPIGMKVWVY